MKICGILDVETALFCAEEGADFIGLNFSPKSIRKIDVATANKIQNALQRKNLKIQLVNLFYQNSQEEIRNILQGTNPDFVQVIAGDLEYSSLSFVKQPIIPAMRIAKPTTDADLDAYRADLYILDSFSKDMGGGTGHTFHWENIATISKRYLLAGGLNPKNVHEALAGTKAIGVDVASGVESHPGKKDLNLIRSFIQNARRK